MVEPRSPWPHAQNLPLGIDERIIDYASKRRRSPLVLYGMTGTGKSYTKSRLEQSLNHLGWAVADVSPDQDLAAQVLAVARGGQPTILLADAASWDMLKRGNRKLPRVESWHHSVERKDATNLVWGLVRWHEREKGIVGLHARLLEDHSERHDKSVVGRILESSMWNDGGKRVYLPGAISATLVDWLAASQLDLTRKGDFEVRLGNATREGGEWFTAETEKLGRVTDAFFTTSAGGQGLASFGPVLAGVQAFVPILVGCGLVAAAFTIYSFFRDRKGKGRKGIFDIDHLLNAKIAWESFAEWKKDVVCYDYERKVGAPRGSARPSMDQLMASPEQSLLTGLSRLSESPGALSEVQAVLGISQLTEVQNIVAEIVASLDARISKLEGARDLQLSWNSNQETWNAKQEAGLDELRRLLAAGGPRPPERSSRVAQASDVAGPQVGQPVQNPSLMWKVEMVRNLLLNGFNVRITGEMGVGKTTLFRLVVEGLISKGVEVWKGEPSGIESGVFARDDATEAFVEAFQSTRPNARMLVTVRSEVADKVRIPTSRDVAVERDDLHTEELTTILLGSLSRAGIQYTKSAVDRAIGKSGGLPGYLVELGPHLKNKGIQRFTMVEADQVPSRLHGMIAEEISWLGADRQATAILLALSRTAGGGLDLLQMELFSDVLGVRSEAPMPTSYLLLDKDVGALVYRLRHPAWKDVLTRDWTSLDVGMTEPPVLVDLRSRSDLDGALRSALEASVGKADRYGKLRATGILRIALENVSAGEERLESRDKIRNRIWALEFPDLDFGMSYPFMLSGESVTDLSDEEDTYMWSYAARDIEFAFTLGRALAAIGHAPGTRDWSRAWDFACSEPSFTIWYFDRISEAYERLSDADRQRVWRLVSGSEQVAWAFGHSWGRDFAESSEEAREEAWEATETIGAFAQGLAMGIAASLGTGKGQGGNPLPNRERERAWRLAKTNSHFRDGWGKGLTGDVFRDLPDSERAAAWELAELDAAFARSVGDALGSNFLEMSVAAQDRMWFFLRRSAKISNGFGMGLGKEFHRLVPKDVERAWAIAERNSEFAAGLGEGLGARGFSRLGEEDQGRIYEFAQHHHAFARLLSKGLALEAVDFETIAEHLGRRDEHYERLSDDLKRWVDANEASSRQANERIWTFAEANPSFAYGFGEGVGIHFWRGKEETRSRAWSLASRVPAFAEGLGTGLRETTFPDPLIAERAEEFASENAHFAKGWTSMDGPTGPDTS